MQLHAWLTRKDEIAEARHAHNEALRALDKEESHINGKLDDLRKVLEGEPVNGAPPDEPKAGAYTRPDETSDGESFPEAVIGAVKAFRGNPLPNEIRSWLCANGSTAAIREQASKPYFYAVLMRHVRKGRLAKVDDGGYRLPPRRRRSIDVDMTPDGAGIFDDQ
jgi:hypothetical protein